MESFPLVKDSYRGLYCCSSTEFINQNPLLNAGIVQIAMGFGRPITDISKLNSYLPLATGAVALFVSAFGRKFGKRPVYVVSSILGVIGVIVGETASGYETLLASRVIQGAAVAAYESLAIASVGDLFFVHERGPRIAILIFFLSAISNGVSIIAGVITSNLGWHYNFHISMPFAALQTILVILFVPETMYRRDAIYEIDTVGSDEKYTNGADTKSTDTAEIEQVLTPGMIPPRKTFIQELKLYNGTFVDDSIWKMLLACPAILLNMGALYQILLTGITIAWYVGIAVITSMIFASPPYLLSSASVGYMSAGPLIGGFFGALFCFLLSEPLLKWLTRRNAGVYEPEFCLMPLSIGCLTTVGGLIGWGYAVERADSIYVACFVWALMLFGMTVIASFSTQYALDAFRSYSTEIFIMNMTFKNVFYYG
jgi:MFS family permease